MLDNKNFDVLTWKDWFVIGLSVVSTVILVLIFLLG